VLIDRYNKTALAIDMAVPFTHTLPKAEAGKITKRENMALENKNISNLNNVSIFPLFISAEGVVTKIFLKCLENMGLTKNILRLELHTVP
jgi:hypothetical protein